MAMRKRYAMANYACGAAAARTGDEMSGPALLLAGLAATGSAATASLPLAGLTVSAAVGGPLFGVLLDRSARPGRLLARAIGGYAAALLVVLACLGRLPVAAAVLVAVGAGLLGPALSGGWTSQLPRVVPEHDLARAHALDAMTFGLATLAAPALAGAAAELSGAPLAVAISAALILLAAPPALALPPSAPQSPRPREPAAPGAQAGGSATPEAQAQRPAPPAAEAPAPRPAPGRWGAARAGIARQYARSVGADLVGGFRGLARSRSLARATATSVVSCAGQGMLLACVPLLGEQDLGGAGHGMLLLSGTAAAGLAANAVLARRPNLLRPDGVVQASALVLAGALALAATGRPVPLVASALLAGVGEGPQLTALFAIRHREAPERLRARVFTTGASLKISGLGLGAAAAGPLAARSLTGALLTAAGVQLLAWPAGRAAGRTRAGQPPEPGCEGPGSADAGCTSSRA